RDDAPTGVGEEDRVDQLRLAARELGHEGDRQPVVGEPRPQPRQALLRALVAKLRSGEPLLVEAERSEDGAAPLGVLRDLPGQTVHQPHSRRTASGAVNAGNADTRTSNAAG